MNKFRELVLAELKTADESETRHQVVQKTWTAGRRKRLAKEVCAVYPGLKVETTPEYVKFSGEILGKNSDIIFYTCVTSDYDAALHLLAGYFSSCIPRSGMKK